MHDIAGFYAPHQLYQFNKGKELLHGPDFLPYASRNGTPSLQEKVFKRIRWSHSQPVYYCMIVIRGVSLNEFKDRSQRLPLRRIQQP